MHLTMDHTYDEPDTVRSDWTDGLDRLFAVVLAADLALWALWRWL